MIKKSLLFLLLIIVFSLFLPQISIAEDKSNLVEVDTNSVLIKFQGEEDYEQIFLGSFTSNASTDSTGILALVEQFKKSPNVIDAQPNYIYRTTWKDIDSESIVPSQYIESRHWYMTNSNVPEMWINQGCPVGDNCGGSKEITVAVVDSGVAFESFDDRSGLTGANFKSIGIYENLNLFENKEEIPNNGIDDDCNGYVDDFNGVDTYAGIVVSDATCLDNEPITTLEADFKKAGHPVDTYGHGSFTTGLIASDIDNIKHVSPTFNVTVMPIAASVHFKEYFTSMSIADGIDYAVENGADVINLSLTTNVRDPFIERSVKDASSKGVIIVAATGNESSTENYYPAAFEDVVAVGAVKDNGEKTSYSNYGDYIDFVGYVGDGETSSRSFIRSYTLSCFPNCNKLTVDDGDDPFSLVGTSFAAPQASSLFAAILSENPTLTKDEAYNIIVDNIIDLNKPGYDLETGYGAINYNFKIENTGTTDPDPVTYPEVKRFWNNKLGIHFYTQSEAKQTQLTRDPDWSDEGYKFKAGQYLNGECSMGEPVYYFKKLDRETYFYTIELETKEYVETTWPSIWEYQDVIFCAFKNPAFGLKPVYRYFSSQFDTHFFTIDQEEKDAIEQNWPEIWGEEGIEFYAYPLTL